LTIAPIQPAPQYDANNEAQFRTQVRQTDAGNIKKDEAAPYITMLNDDGAPWRVYLIGGVLTPQVIP